MNPCYIDGSWSEREVRLLLSKDYIRKFAESKPGNTPESIDAALDIYDYPLSSEAKHIIRAIYHGEDEALRAKYPMAAYEVDQRKSVWKSIHVRNDPPKSLSWVASNDSL